MYNIKKKPYKHFITVAPVTGASARSVSFHKVMLRTAFALSFPFTSDGGWSEEFSFSPLSFSWAIKESPVGGGGTATVKKKRSFSDTCAKKKTFLKETIIAKLVVCLCPLSIYFLKLILVPPLRCLGILIRLSLLLLLLLLLPLLFLFPPSPQKSHDR